MAEQAKEQRVESVERALTLLEAFAEGADRLSLAELAKRTGYYRSTILRLAASLQRMGYLHRDAEGSYRLGPTLWRLGSQYQRAFRLADYIRPALSEISAETGESAAFYVREGDQRVVLYRVNSDRPTRHHIEEGSALPLDRGAGGRILTVYTGGDDEHAEQIRTQGYYVSDGERSPEAGAVAVPVFGMDGGFVGALGVVGPRNRMDADHRDRITELLLQYAERIGRQLGSRRSAGGPDA
ncbi:IclR family transcriptional regulator [Pseudonocardia sp. ICBG601]|uniref:IclR family transcriptional regulator n=1 Tax=Pseudonocardia sp. ICBG601 TaxID=2846759 RepID=UPI001CF70598|nr:IclR family transcriptional regulator [Pseudonocardia sp. ICBG601]